MEGEGDLSVPALQLSEFLAANIEEIVAAWEARVRRLPATQCLPSTQLRGNIPQILERLAEGLAGPASPSAALGELPEVHVVERLDAGFELSDVVFELAALRDSILDLWQIRSGSGAQAASMRRVTHVL